MTVVVTSTILPVSLYGRLRLLLAALFGLGGIAALTGAWLFSAAAATEAYDRLLISAAVQIAETIAARDDAVSVLPPDSAFETLALAQNDRFFYAVRDPRGTLLTGFSGLNNSSAAPGQTTPVTRNGTYGTLPVRIAYVDHFVAAPTRGGWTRVIVAQTTEARHAMAMRLLIRIGALVALVSILGYVAALEAARRALRPLDRIGAALAARSSQSTSPLTVAGPREIEPLVQAINIALSRLAERTAKLQSFAAVAAHQIRTPLAALSAQTELLGHDEAPATRSRRLRRLQTNITKLSRLANQLLGQAMTTYRSETVSYGIVAFGDLVRSVIHDAVPQSLDRDLKIDTQGLQDALAVRGDPVMLREALANLIGNAVTHGAPGLLRVATTTTDSFICVSIADDGPGISPELWEAACEPFRLVRAEREGAGLGLAIASDVARAHGGTLRFGRTADNLFEVALLLPRGEMA